MAKATMTFRNGTRVVVEGTVEEVRRLLTLCDTSEAPPSDTGASLRRQMRAAGGSAPHATTPSGATPQDIARVARDCPEAAAIATRILDGRSQLNRALLPLYIVAQYLEGSHALTVREISAVTRKLGALVEPPNVAKAIRMHAKGYVMVEGGRNGSGPRRLRLSRRGIQYIKSVLKNGAK